MGNNVSWTVHTYAAVAVNTSVFFAVLRQMSKREKIIENAIVRPSRVVSDSILYRIATDNMGSIEAITVEMAYTMPSRR